MIDFTISRISGFQYYDSWQFGGCSEVHGHIKSGTIDSEVRILCAAISCGMDHRQRRSDCCAAQFSQFYGGKKHFVNPKVLVSRNQFMQFWRICHHPDTSVQIDIRECRVLRRKKDSIALSRSTKSAESPDVYVPTGRPKQMFKRLLLGNTSGLPRGIPRIRADPSARFGACFQLLRFSPASEMNFQSFPP